MPETDTIPVSASVASTGKGIRYIGDHAYAYSGVISVTDSEITLLEFTTGVGYLTAKLQINFLPATENNIEYLIYLNEIVVQGYHVKGGGLYTEPDNPLFLLIPPLTSFKATAENKTTTTGRDHAATLIGKVYGEK